tara:strand:+ start:433 stop:1446 length:1014 start_codon:yes stop_codon:yes gene_type:complete
MENKKIFLLGATGQIGKELALEFKNTTNINFLCHSRTSVGSSFFDFYKIKNIVGEIKNENIISEIKIADLIFDLAAPNSGTLREIKNFYKKRVDLIIPNMKKNSRYVFASTMNAYGIDNERKILKNYLFSSSIYATNKRYAEKYISKIGKKNNIDVYLLRLAEVHGKFQRASLNITEKIEDNRIFEIPETPAWITFISLIKDAIINIIFDKEKPGLYTLVCDDIFWGEFLNILGEKSNRKAKYYFSSNRNDLNIFKKILYKILIQYKDIIRGNFEFPKKFEDYLKLNYRVNRIKNIQQMNNEDKICREYNRYIGVLPGKRLKSISYRKEEIFKNLLL